MTGLEPRYCPNCIRTTPHEKDGLRRVCTSCGSDKQPTLDAMQRARVNQGIEGKAGESRRTATWSRPSRAF